VTQDRARKKAARARMAASGEPYSVAARRVAGPDPAGGAAAVAEVIARLDRTLAAPSARVQYRMDIESLPKDLTPAGEFIGNVVKAAWERVVPGRIRTWLDEASSHQVAAGIIEPAAGRYQMTYRGGSTSKVSVDGERFDGFDGAPLADWNKSKHDSLQHEDDPLAWLRLLPGATEARYAGGEALRGTPCRKVILGKIPPDMRVRLLLSGDPEDPAGFTVWTDEEHIRQVQAEVIYPDKSGVKTMTLELWDFGVPAGSLDWTRFPAYPG
jgi:hypothetical protein